MVTATDCWSASVLVFSPTAAWAALSVQTATASAARQSVRFMERPFLVDGQAINGPEREKGLASPHPAPCVPGRASHADNRFAVEMPASAGDGGGRQTRKLGRRHRLTPPRL